MSPGKRTGDLGEEPAAIGAAIVVFLLKFTPPHIGRVFQEFWKLFGRCHAGFLSCMAVPKIQSVLGALTARLRCNPPAPRCLRTTRSGSDWLDPL